MAQSAGMYVRAPKRPKKTKSNNLSKELADEKAMSAHLASELEQSRKEVENLKSIMHSRDSDRPSTSPSLEFEVQNRFSSTRRMLHNPNSVHSVEESRFLASMNHLSLASISIPECKASEGEDIHRQVFEQWKDLLIDTLKLAGIEDEATMFTVFKKPEESDLHFITRVGTIARLCEFDEHKEFEEIVATIAEHARNRDVRTAALKMLSRKGNFTDLVDKVRELEAIRLNEEYDKTCHRCGLVGHIQRACPRRSQGKRPAQGYPEAPPLKVASIEKTDETELGEEPGTSSRKAVAAVRNPCQEFSSELTSTLRGASCVSKTPEIASARRDRIKTEKVQVLGLPSNSSLGKTSRREQEVFDEGVIYATVAGLRCPFLIDSGAQVNTFTEELFNKLMSDPVHCKGVFNIEKQSDRVLKAYASSGNIDVIATFHAYLFVTEDRPTFLEKFYVVREMRALLGRSTASRYSILLLGMKVPVRSFDYNDDLSLCTGGIASIDTNDVFPKFNVPPVKILYDRSKPPCRNIFFNIPLSVKPLVENRIQGLVRANIIEPVVDGMDTSFCSSMLVVPKGKEDVRLVIDLRGPNRYIYRTPFAMPTLEKILAELNGASWFSTIDLLFMRFHHREKLID
ncbi:uncharacterized protein LOC134207552 [Armigeres subalbatus]|uniref:uncharacterized protein LOC134207552 n=1 Tax=Armigeres subalbatus TaxID=124917 RepID=UPI002ED68FD0